MFFLDFVSSFLLESEFFNFRYVFAVLVNVAYTAMKIAFVGNDLKNAIGKPEYSARKPRCLAKSNMVPKKDGTAAGAEEPADATHACITRVRVKSNGKIKHQFNMPVKPPTTNCKKKKQNKINKQDNHLNKNFGLTL